MPNQFQDPREIVTPDAFTVAPELLGLPLARPSRRLAAMLLDLLLVFLLVRLGGFVLFVVAAAWMFFRVGGRSAGGGLLRRSWRLSFRFLAALVLLLALVLVWNSVRSRFRVRSEPPRAEAVVDAEAEAEDAEAARAAMAEVVARLQERGVDAAPLRAVMDSLRREVEEPASRRASANSDSLALLYAEAVSAGDSASAAALRPRLAEALAGERIATLEGRISRVERSNRRLRRELEEAREGRGILSFLRVAADELGLGFGWIGLYFTVFTTLWRGQTPGKRLLGIRVLRLDGKPIGWWASFERFGGYAASVLT
ncbi:MAG TPA: RDD family protein, partial [Longimicrobiaceae bacterium]|nr:RDD family protein [Longimicrobiaceae bacterium]